MTPSASHETKPKRRLLARRWPLVLQIPAGLVILTMMLHVTANALSRTFFNAPLSNSLEITQYWYLPVAALLGFVVAQHEGQHIAADLIYQYLPAATKRYVSGVLLSVAALVCLAATWFTLSEALHAYSVGMTAGASSLTAWPAYFFAPLAFGFLVIQFSLAGIRALKTDEPSDKQSQAVAPEEQGTHSQEGVIA